MIELLAYPTQRPAWIDPDHVTAITDLLEASPPAIAGGQPRLAIVGTQVVVDGYPVNLAGHAEVIAERIQAARSSKIRMMPVGH
jgi:hypothetical protein